MILLTCSRSILECLGGCTKKERLKQVPQYRETCGKGNWKPAATHRKKKRRWHICETYIDDILVARIVSAKISDIHRKDTGGFVDRIPDDYKKRRYMRGKVDEYNRRGGYHKRTIQSVWWLHRKGTPTHVWETLYARPGLAEMMCNEVITKDYTSERTKSFRRNKSTKPVTDPSCGSGTFLCRAIYRIQKSDAFKDYYIKDDSTKFLTCMISGGYGYIRLQSTRHAQTPEDCCPMQTPKTQKQDKAIHCRCRAPIPL